jgi:hypothetical protein
LTHPENDQIRYVLNAFGHIEVSETTQMFGESWKNYWDRGTAPV